MTEHLKDCFLSLYLHLSSFNPLVFLYAPTPALPAPPVWDSLPLFLW